MMDINQITDLYGWRHYEVLNIFKNRQEVEMFCICESKIKIIISYKDLKDPSKWSKGWVEKEIIIN